MDTSPTPIDLPNPLPQCCPLPTRSGRAPERHSISRRSSCISILHAAKSSSSAECLCCILSVGNHGGNKKKGEIQQQECQAYDPALTGKCKNNRKGKDEAYDAAVEEQCDVLRCAEIRRNICPAMKAPGFRGLTQTLPGGESYSRISAARASER